MRNDLFLKEIGIKIKTARKAKDLNLVTLSKSCGIHITQLSFIENGKSNLHILTLKGIADILGKDVRDLI